MPQDEQKPSNVMSHTGPHRAYAWLPALIVVMTVVALVVGALALRHLATQLVATKGEGLEVRSSALPPGDSTSSSPFPVALQEHMMRVS